MEAIQEKMKIRLFSVILFVFGINYANIFEGIWLQKSRTKGGLGTQINIFSGSEADITFGAIVDTKYRFEKGILYLSDSQNGYDSVGYRLCGDTLFSMDKSNPKKMKLKGYLESQEPRTKIDSIVGTWTFKYNDVVPSFYRFSGNGTGYLHVQMMRKKATYQNLDSNKIKIRFGKNDSDTFSINKERTNLVDNNGQQYERFDFMPQ